MTIPMPTTTRTGSPAAPETVRTGVPTVVLAVDDAEPTSSADLRIAAAEARRRGASIRVVHGCATYSPAGIIGTSVTDERLHYGQYVLNQAVRILHELSGFEVDIATVNSSELGADLLLAESRTAALVVVLHARTSPERLSPGATARLIADRARCPVLVVHPDDTAEVGSGVVVAAGALGSNTALLRLAAAEAVRRGASLTVVHPWQVWDDHWAAARGLSRGVADTVAEGVAREELAVAVLDLAADFPSLGVASRLVCGPPVDVLLAASAGATVMVLGRPEDAAAEREFGEISTALFSRAHCPVLVLQANPIGALSTSAASSVVHP